MPSKRSQHMAPDADPISLDHFPMSRAVWLNKKIYNAAFLSRMLKADRYIVPHTRRRLTPDEINTIMFMSGRRHKDPTLFKLPSTLSYDDYQSTRKSTRNGRRPWAPRVYTGEYK